MVNRPESFSEGANTGGPLKTREEHAAVARPAAAPSRAMRPSSTPLAVPSGTAARSPIVAQAIIREGKRETADPVNLNAGERVANAAAAAKARINEQREPAARALENAAATLRHTAENLPGGQRLSGTANRAASKLESAAGYVREHDLQDAVGDAARLVKRYPGRSLLAAVAAGFLVGRAFRK